MSKFSEVTRLAYWSHAWPLYIKYYQARSIGKTLKKKKKTTEIHWLPMFINIKSQQCTLYFSEKGLVGSVFILAGKLLLIHRSSQMEI